MRNLLAFDTSAAHCAAALLCGGRIVASRHEAMDKGQAERLIPLLDAVLAEGGLAWSDLDALAVGTGPGNFTGVRIAVAAARGLALSLGVPAIGVTTLEARAHGLHRPLAVVEDARRGEVYLQEFDVQPDGVQPDGVQPDGARVTTLGALAAECRFDRFAGSAADAAVQAVGGLALPSRPIAEAIALVAAARDAHLQPRPAPFYLRGADAAPPADPPPVILP